MSLPSFRDRLRITWEVSWPVAALDLAAAILTHGVLKAQGETLDSLWAVAVFFVVSPWAVRRALARNYGDRQAVAVASGGKETRRLGYQQSLKVMWLLAWRSTVMALVGLLLLSAVLHWAGFAARDLPAQSPLVNAVGLSLADAATSLLFFPFLIAGMLRKRYRDFHLEWRCRKPESQSAGKAGPARQVKGRKPK
ncbi:MAG TPA: hypothetical protein VKV74_12845 [Bryobacteraceae bacterium]|nr:hypothetical protein [Bryobacteraceae bacterium]